MLPTELIAKIGTKSPLMLNAIADTMPEIAGAVMELHVGRAEHDGEKWVVDKRIARFSNLKKLVVIGSTQDLNLPESLTDLEAPNDEMLNGILLPNLTRLIMPHSYRYVAKSEHLVELSLGYINQEFVLSFPNLRILHIAVQHHAELDLRSTQLHTFHCEEPNIDMLILKLPRTITDLKCLVDIPSKSFDEALGGAVLKRLVVRYCTTFVYPEIDYIKHSSSPAMIMDRDRRSIVGVNFHACADISKFYGLGAATWNDTEGTYTEDGALTEHWPAKNTTMDGANGSSDGALTEHWHAAGIRAGANQMCEIHEPYAARHGVVMTHCLHTTIFNGDLQEFAGEVPFSRLVKMVVECLVDDVKFPSTLRELHLIAYRMLCRQDMPDLEVLKVRMRIDGSVNCRLPSKPLNAGDSVKHISLSKLLGAVCKSAKLRELTVKEITVSSELCWDPFPALEYLKLTRWFEGKFSGADVAINVPATLRRLELGEFKVRDQPVILT